MRRVLVHRFSEAEADNDCHMVILPRADKRTRHPSGIDGERAARRTGKRAGCRPQGNGLRIFLGHDEAYGDDKMRKSMLWLASAGLLALVPVWPAYACDGDKIIFEDKFDDDAGGWSHKDNVEVKDGSFIFNLPPDDMQSNLNVTFTVEDGDICAEAVWPEGGDQPVLGAGLLFWGEDNRSYYQFGVLNNGKFWIARKQDGAWLGTIAANVESPAINQSPGAANTLRVDAKGNAVTFYINGTKVRELRGQAPTGAWRFGLSGDNFDKKKEAKVLFTSVKVTN
jgi:3-keto-disaccharide hydrolase